MKTTNKFKKGQIVSQVLDLCVKCTILSVKKDGMYIINRERKSRGEYYSLGKTEIHEDFLLG